MYGGNIDFFTMKGIAEALLDKAGVYGWDIEALSLIHISTVIHCGKKHVRRLERRKRNR